MDSKRIIQATFVEDVRWLDSVNSTNSLALMLPADVSLPCLIGATEQTAGRGRGQNEWWAAPGALTFSLVIDPRQTGILPAQWPALSLTTGLALCEALDWELPPGEVQLKWPNDVYLNGRKLAGILIESAGIHSGRLVIGIGVNVNNSFQQAPDNLQQRATALIDQLGSSQPLEALLIRILVSLQRELEALGSGDPGLPDRWRGRCLLTGRRIRIEDSREVVEGLCIGIDGDAALKIMTSSGVRRLFSGTVKLLDQRSD